VIPGVFGIDVASVVLLIALKYVELYLIQLIHGLPASPVVLLLATFVDLIGMTINVFFFAVIIRALLSWFSPYGIRHTPAGSLLASLTEPLLRPARRLIPPVGGLDLSPLVVLVVLQIAQLALNHFLRGP
jgi:YggT family protein